MPDINLSPYTAEQQAIDRRRKMAELLQQQSSAPIEMPTVAGVRVSPYAGLAKLLQSYGAERDIKKVEQEQKALGEKYQGERTSQFQDLARLLSAPGQAAQPAVEPVFNEGQSTITQGGQEAKPALPAGYLPAEALSKFTNPDIQQLAMSRILSQIEPKAPIKLGADESLLNPNSYEVVATGKSKETYHPPVNEFDPNSGQTLKVAYSNLGTRKVIDTAGAYTLDQWNAIPAEAKAKLLFDQYKFGNLSAEQLLQAGQKNAQLGQELIKLQFETGKGGPGPVTIPTNAPMPNPMAAPAPVAAPVAQPAVAPVTTAQAAPKAKKPYTQLNAPAPTQPEATQTDQPPAGLSPKAQQQWILENAKNKPLTESQGNAAAFGLRMKESNKILNDLENQGVTNTGAIRSAVAGTVGLTPFVGENLAEKTSAAMNALPSFMGGPSGEQQQVDQARRNFITAVLRKESGASISPTEFSNEEKKYFPQAGDTDKVIAQKRAARDLAIQAMDIQSGNNRQAGSPRNPQAGATSNNDPLGLRKK
jgi:hypothetical protein